MTSFSDVSDVSDDILENIMSRLPAKSFAAAACVSRLWNRVSNSILLRPRFASGFSFAIVHEVAVDEALEMALSKPIRPYFVIAFVALPFPVDEIHDRIKSKIGSNTILITSAVVGIIGINSFTNELKEVNWAYEDVVNADDAIIQGVSLVIGYVPGLKINVLPILGTNSEPHVVMADKFLSDVRNFTVSVSGDTNQDPVGIIVFGNFCKNLKTTLAEIDTKISRDIVMIGDAYNYFVCNIPSISNFDSTRYILNGIALVFAKDTQNNEVEIKFHVGISSGIIPIGPVLEIFDVLEYEGRYSWLSVRMEGEFIPLDTSYTLQSLHSLIEDKLYYLYIGIKKVVPQNEGPPITYTEFHEILGTEENMFLVRGVDINPGDSGLFYHSDVETANDSNQNLYNRFNFFSEPPPRRARRQMILSDQSHNEKVFGGMLFASSIRGDKFFGKAITDCLPFSNNFPDVPLGGAFCLEPIGRSPVLEDEEWHCEEERFNMQAVNAVHLVMSYKML